jgi:putative hydrolase of HD superfamily
MTETDQLLDFFLATDRLKHIARENRVLDGSRHETVAEHCWHVTLLALTLADAAPAGTDIDHVVNLLTIHDLVEVYAGDTVIWWEADEAEVAAREQEAADRLFAQLPDSARPRFAELNAEFMAQETVEARFARALDALHPLLMTWGTRGAGHVRKDLTVERIVAKKQPLIGPFPALWALAEQVIAEAVARGLLALS